MVNDIAIGLKNCSKSSEEVIVSSTDSSFVPISDDIAKLGNRDIETAICSFYYGMCGQQMCPVACNRRIASVGLVM